MGLSCQDDGKDIHVIA